MSGGPVSSGVVVAGLGAGDRGDDGVGRAVLEELGARGLGRPGAATARLVVVSDPTRLLEEWDDEDLVVVVDATRGGGEPGTISVTDLDRRLLGSGTPAGASTHGTDLGWVLRLARQLGRGPRRALLVGVEGADFRRGAGLTGPVAAAVPRAAESVLSLLGGTDLCA